MSRMWWYSSFAVNNVSIYTNVEKVCIPNLIQFTFRSNSFPIRASPVPHCQPPLLVPGQRPNLEIPVWWLLGMRCLPSPKETKVMLTVIHYPFLEFLIFRNPYILVDMPISSRLCVKNFSPFAAGIKWIPDQMGYLSAKSYASPAL